MIPWAYFDLDGTLQEKCLRIVSAIQADKQNSRFNTEIVFESDSVENYFFVAGKVDGDTQARSYGVVRGAAQSAAPRKTKLLQNLN